MDEDKKKIRARKKEWEKRRLDKAAKLLAQAEGDLLVVLSYVINHSEFSCCEIYEAKGIGDKLGVRPHSRASKIIGFIQSLENRLSEPAIKDLSGNGHHLTRGKPLID